MGLRQNSRIVTGGASVVRRVAIRSLLITSDSIFSRHNNRRRGSHVRCTEEVQLVLIHWSLGQLDQNLAQGLRF